MKVAIAGSHLLPRGQGPRLLIAFLAALPDGSVILLRRPKNPAEMTGLFEQDVASMAGFLRFDVEWCRPEPTATSPGRASVYRRDIEMVERADLVLLFFAADEVAEGYGGTQHLLDKALDAGRPVYAYSVDEFGTIDRVGEYDPEHMYDNIAPRP